MSASVQLIVAGCRPGLSLASARPAAVGVVLPLAPEEAAAYTRQILARPEELPFQERPLYPISLLSCLASP